MERVTLLLLAIGIGGCVHLPCWQKDEPAAPAEAEAPPHIARRSVSKVSAEQINEKNAHQKAQALINELDHAEDLSDQTSEPEKPTLKKKK